MLRSEGTRTLQFRKQQINKWKDLIHITLLSKLDNEKKTEFCFILLEKLFPYCPLVDKK